MTLRQQSSDESLREEDFAAIAELAAERWGLAIAEEKRALVHSRLRRLSKAMGSIPVQDVVEHFRKKTDGAELLPLFDALSTNETSFFRHPEQFEFLREGLKAHPAGRELKIWSAGCSEGCEPYSIAITALEADPRLAGRTRILATDLSITALRRARTGLYEERQLRGVPAPTRERFFDSVTLEGLPYWRVRAAVTNLVTFGLVNLMERWRMKGPFDVIFCRNVMIYFARPTRDRLVARFADLLRPGGALIVGNSENIGALPDNLERTGPFCFVRAA